MQDQASEPALIMFLTRKKTALLLLIMAVFLLIIDRFLKNLAMAGVTFSVFPDLLSFSLAKNYFVAFSLPLGGNILLFLIFIILIFLSYLCFQACLKTAWIQAVLYLWILIGASSNLLDRLKYGYVVDYLDLRFFTVFNIADALIVLAAFLLAWQELSINQARKNE